MYLMCLCVDCGVQYMCLMHRAFRVSLGSECGVQTGMSDKYSWGQGFNMPGSGWDFSVYSTCAHGELSRADIK